MENFYLTLFIVTGFISIVFLSVMFTNLILSDDAGKKYIKYNLPLFVLFGLLSFISMQEEGKLSSARIEEERKMATYYEVTEDTKNKISVYCKNKHPKYSTQQTCKRTTEYALKHGKSSNGFTPSDVVVKPSGVPVK